MAMGGVCAARRPWGPAGGRRVRSRRGSAAGEGANGTGHRSDGPVVPQVQQVSRDQTHLDSGPGNQQLESCCSEASFAKWTR